MPLFFELSLYIYTNNLYLHKQFKAMKKTTFKIWCTVEKHEVDTETGEETFTDIEDNIVSAGKFDTENEANLRLDLISDTFGGDFTTEE